MGLWLAGKVTSATADSWLRKLKAPPSKTAGFAQTLSAELSSTVPERRNVSLLKRFFDGIGECYGSKSILEEGVDVTLVEDRVGDLYLEEQGRRLLPTGEAPVHILDDFNEDSPENRSFLIRTCDPS